MVYNRYSYIGKENGMELEEKYISGEKIFDGVILHVVKDTVKLPSGNTATRELIRHVGAVGIVALTDNGEVYMERQFRYPVNEVVYEIPAGKLDSKEEDPLLAAKRELSEETGLTADKWQYLGEIYPAAAYTDERLRIYLATGLHSGNVHLDEDEFINVEKVKLEDVAKDVVAGKIPDSKTQASIMRVMYMKEHGLI